MQSQIPTVFVIDPDPRARHLLEETIRRGGWLPVVVTSARPFLPTAPGPAPSCLVMDVGALLPDVGALELLRRLATTRQEIPVVAVSQEPSIPLTVRAIQAGAVEFLIKPLADGLLRAAIGRALAHSEAVLRTQAELLELRTRHESLSRRERDVMTRIVSGSLNKQVGADLGISEITVKAHRGRVMRKMGADSLARLVTMALRLGLSPAAAS